MNELILEGLKIMVVGMGMVFVFLVTMVICMLLQGKLLAPFSHLLAVEPQAPKRKAAAPSIDPAAVAAAVAAKHATKK